MTVLMIGCDDLSQSSNQSGYWLEPKFSGQNL